jgi:putative transcriptional regulator
MKNRLRVYRTMTNLTQGELAEKLGITRQTVIAVEKERYDPSLELAFKLARLFRVSVEDIFQYEG